MACGADAAGGNRKHSKWRLGSGLGGAETAGGEGDEQDSAEGKNGVADADAEACAAQDGRLKEGVPGVAEGGSGGEGELVRGSPGPAAAEHKDERGDAQLKGEDDGCRTPAPAAGNDKDGGAGGEGDEAEEPRVGSGLGA